MNYSNYAKKSSSLAFWSGMLAVVALTACNQEKVQSYSVSKNDSAANPMTAPGMGGALPAGHPDMGAPVQPQVAWKTPASWTEIAPGEMRLASFVAKGKDNKQADISIVPLPGLAGGDSANVNRWRGQVGLEPLSPEELQKTMQPVVVADQPAELYEQVGKNPGSGEPMAILAAIQHRDGTAWFYKMTGDPAVVTEHKATFLEFLKSVAFQTAQTAALPAGHPTIDAGSPATMMPGLTMTSAPADGPISHEGQPNWQIPAGWQEVAGGQFLVAKFTISGDAGAQAAVNISSSPGEGGGLEANVNRWRTQLGLAALTGADLTKSLTSLDVAGGKASLMEMSGKDARTGQATQLVGVIVSQANQTWFYKLMGDAKVVEVQKDAFTKFVQTVKY